MGERARRLALGGGAVVLAGAWLVALPHVACSAFEASADAVDGSAPDTSPPEGGAPDGATGLDSGLRPGLSDCGTTSPVDLQSDPIN
jgi:hypothetical protein